MTKSRDHISLFTDFTTVSTAEWIKKAEEDLKGVPIEKLTWHVADGIKLKPFYREEDLKDLDYLDSEPGCFPFVRTGKKGLNEWNIQQDITVTDIKTANASALHALKNGADSLLFEFKSTAHISEYDLKNLLHKIDIAHVKLNFYAPGNEELIISLLSEEQSYLPDGNNKIQGSLYFDPLGQLAATGSFFMNEEDDFTKCSRLIGLYSSQLPDFRLVAINGTVFHNSGGTAIQELAFSLASASEYLERLSNKGISVDMIAKSFLLNLAAGPQYFIEIAKFRAARLLFSCLLETWGLKTPGYADIYIHATTSEWNQTIFDPYMNMLRGTTEGMAAIAGGANSLTVLPFGRSFRKSTDFGERIARNTQIILKEEAYFDKVIDPSAGAYYIEKITDSLAESSWNLFLETEKRGGFSASLKSGFIQHMLKETASRRDMDLATRKEILVGTNQYPDPEEKPNFDCEVMVAFPEINVPENCVVEPLAPYRGARAFENLRIRTGNHRPEKPKVFLLSYGNPKWSTARAAFSSNFFGCAGYEIIRSHSYNSITEGTQAALKAGASIIVLCSSDDQYPDVAPEIKNIAGDKALIVIAGFPKDSIEFLKSSGVEHFIHMNSDAIQELEKFHKLLGVK